MDYSVGDVEKLLRLSRATIRALVAAGFVTPARGPRNTLRFSFQDLIVLRTAQALADARVPAQRITRSLKALRRQLPEAMPLSGFSIGAVGDRVVVRDGAGRRQADSGQYLLAFEGNPESGALKVFQTGKRPAAPPQGAAEEAFERALALESTDAEAAIEAYGEAIAAQPERLAARINLGRLLHESGRLAQAEGTYRAALRECGDDPVLLFNLGVLLEDRGRDGDAIKAYAAAVAGDPGLADCHYNLALLYQKQKKPREALRHMSHYRRLVAAAPR